MSELSGNESFSSHLGRLNESGNTFLPSLPLAFVGFPHILRVIVVLEGHHDVEFLRILSSRLHADSPMVPDLMEMERQGQLIFLPIGGGDIAAWAQRLAPLGYPEFHLYDREQSPETEVRRTVVAAINLRPHCRAALTRKRSLENYLHPTAIRAATGILLEFDDETFVGELFAMQSYLHLSPITPWEMLSRRSRKRLANRAKRLLNLHATTYMTGQLLAERDPAGELLGWLQSIRDFATSHG